MSEFVRRTSQLSKPIGSRLATIDIELTERCNNRCIHCYINQAEDDQIRKSNEMDTALVQDILAQAAELGCLSVRFTGGEPLLRDDFAELYLFARRLGLTVLLFTNARLITPELADLFVRIPPGKFIEVSVYGMHSSSYDAVAGVKGAFVQFQRGINLLLEKAIPFIVKQSLLPQLRNEQEEFEHFAANIVKMKNAPEYERKFDLRARRDDPAKNRRIEALRAPAEQLQVAATREPEKYFAEKRQFVGSFMKPQGDKLFSCGAGRGMCIDAYGNGQMCMLLRHPDTVHPAVNAKHCAASQKMVTTSLRYMLDEFFPKLRQIKAANPDYLRRCARCFLKGLCDQCPGKSWEEHGVLDKPVEYLCRSAHAEARFLGLIAEGERAWEIREEERRARIEAFVSSQEREVVPAGV